LVIVLVFAAMCPIIWAISRASLAELKTPYLLLVALVTVPHIAIINMRVRSTNHGLSPASVGALVCVAFAPPHWAILCTAAGITIAKLLKRQPPIKLAFNVAKEVLSATGAVAGTMILGFVPVDSSATVRPGLAASTLMLVAGALAYALVEEIVGTPVLAFAMGTQMRKLLVLNGDIKLSVRLGSLAAAIGSYIVLLHDAWLLLLVLPSLLYGLHIASAIQIRGRSEREAWQRLAQATDEFNSVDLDGVLRTAVTRAADLFSVDEVEVEIVRPPRLVRGDAEGVRYDGPPGDPSPAPYQAIPIELATSADQLSLGELRLVVRGGQISLSERENYTLTTFAAALCTAIRNASTHAETKRLAESHARAAAIDPLTGLGNRRRLSEFATEVLSAQPPEGVTALLLIDLNHFKEINDTLGHSAGDQVLVEVATRLLSTAQPTDLVVRLGGDEFAIMLTGLTAPALATSRAHALLAALNPPMEVDGVRISIEASGGVALAPGDCNVEELLRRADVAMYQAKRDGRPICVFARATDTADVGTLSLAGDLARAINDGEFIVKFQPIVDLGSGMVIAAEALTRWRHPQRGDLSPYQFLDSVERSGQLAAFADLVLDQALAAASRWRDAGFDLMVAVNVSPRSLLDASFPDSVEARIGEYDLPAGQIMVELTETVTLSQLEVVDHVLRRLRELGVKLALDDFGTGYSSLATLARVPVHELKIDRSFVAEMDSAREAAVIRSTIELGRSLDLIVVAEGVEYDRQRVRLWELGCPTGQGHLFARPMPADRLLATLQRGYEGRPGTLAAPLHEEGSVIRIPPSRLGRGQGSQSAEG
jgi:diguanylate cyclase (GGDEF)-like protein